MARFSSRSWLPITYCLNVPITGTGAVIQNVFQLFGSVRVLEQVAEIASVTTLTNMTNVYADLWDGTNSVLLTADGATLSNAPVGTIFTKDQDVTQPYSVSLADQCRMSEVVDAKRIGKPFTVTQESAADTFIRFRYTTTDAPLSFSMLLKFVFEPLDGGNLVLV
jgi:hypothetical protein